MPCSYDKLVFSAGWKSRRLEGFEGPARETEPLLSTVHPLSPSTPYKLLPILLIRYSRGLAVYADSFAKNFLPLLRGATIFLSGDCAVSVLVPDCP